MKRYVWLKPDFTFSNSWTEPKKDWFLTDEEIKKAMEDKGYRLIEYTCLNDEDFEFTHHMKMK